MKISFFQTILFKKCFQLHIVIVITKKKKMPNTYLKIKTFFVTTKNFYKHFLIKFM